MTATQYAIRQRLEDRLASLRRRTGALERENDEVLAGLDEGGRAEIARIEAALARMMEGSYGTCARCGQAIAPERLEVLPFAGTCVGCAGQEPGRGSPS